MHFDASDLPLSLLTEWLGRWFREGEETTTATAAGHTMIKNGREMRERDFFVLFLV
jgi:hypothetical protein